MATKPELPEIRHKRWVNYISSGDYIKVLEEYTSLSKSDKITLEDKRLHLKALEKLGIIPFRRKHDRYQR